MAEPRDNNFSSITREGARRLSDADLRSALAIIDGVQQSETIPHFLPQTHAALLEAIPADGLGLAVTRYRAGMSAVAVDIYGLADFSEEHFTYYSQHAMEHPYARHFVETGDCRALRVSDLMPTQQWIKTRFWKTCLAWLNYRYEMLAVWPLGRNSIFNITFDRIQKNFSARDKHLLNTVFPFIGRHYQTLTRIARAQAAQKKSKRMTPSKHTLDIQRLTPREREVFRWLGQGKDNREIAVILNISLRTVQKHMEQILRKLRLENRYAAATMASLME